MNRCYICDAPAQERDHFPVSKSLGGTTTFPICLKCHDDKDRATVDKWDPAIFHASLLGLWSKATPEERLTLAKIFHIANQGVATFRTLEAGRSRNG